MSTPHPTDRRAFLGRASALLASGALLPSLSAQWSPWNDKRQRLVVVYLRGGADALNIVVPYANDRYHGMRPTIAIPAESKPGAPGVLPLGDEIGLHPALRPLMPHWEAGRFGAVLNVGSPHPTRSHFDAQDFMEYASPGDRTVREGWLNRYLTAREGDHPLRALGMQGLLPRALRGQYPVLAVPRLRKRESEGLLDLFDDIYKTKGGKGEMGGARQGDPAMRDDSPADAAGREAAVQVGRNTIHSLRHLQRVLDKAPKAKGKYPRHRLGHRLATLARLIRAGEPLEVAALDFPSWDHHANEGGTDGQLNTRLEVLAQAISAFTQDLGPELDRTLVVVMTEFGRNVAENGNRGTDHGRGGMMLALGGPVSGGVFGDYGSLEKKELADGRDLPIHIDFRTVFHEVLTRGLGFAPPKDFFPRWRPTKPLGILKT